VVVEPDREREGGLRRAHEVARDLVARTDEVEHALAAVVAGAGDVARAVRLARVLAAGDRDGDGPARGEVAPALAEGEQLRAAVAVDQQGVALRRRAEQRRAPRLVEAAAEQASAGHAAGDRVGASGHVVKFPGP